jgi:hypothetical protein
MPFDGTGDGRGEVLQKLERVIDLLSNEERWCKGIAETPGGRRCLMGAIRKAEGQLLLEPIVLQAIREVTGRNYWRIESFNDAKATSHALVLEVLERASENVAAGRNAAAPRRTGMRSWWRSLSAA